MEVCCGFFGFGAGDAIEEQEEENPFHAPQEKQKPKHPLGVARHKPAHKKKKHRVIPKHHHAARASTVAKGNGTRDHCALPKPTGVAWDGLTAMMPITDPQWEKDFMERLDRIEASDLLRPSATDGSTVLMFACEHRDALAMSLILVHLHLYELRNWMITKRNANGWNAACYVNEVPAGHPVAVLLNEEMAMVGIEEGERDTHVLPAAPATSPFAKVGSFFKHKPAQ
jgi:hypothetical protein